MIVGRGRNCPRFYMIEKFAEYLTKIELHAAENGLTLYAPHYRDLALYGEK